MKLPRALGFLLLSPGVMLAHAGEELQPHDLWSAWRFDPGIVIPLLLSAFLYARGARPALRTPRWRVVCFWAGMVWLVLALLSPLHPLGEVLFSAHMVQHEVLMLVCAPLLVLSRPLVPLLWGMPFEWRRRVGHWCRLPVSQSVWHGLTHPATAWFVHGAILWLWHAPPAFQATLRSDWIHSAQHISFFGSALLFWWSLFYATGSRGYGSAVLYLFTTAVHTSILGALLTFGRTLWYPAYQASAPLWGLSPLEDQQLGGVIMWVPGGVVYVVAALVLFARWLRESDFVAERGPYGYAE